jgi:hypothetical protein
VGVRIYKAGAGLFFVVLFLGGFPDREGYKLLYIHIVLDLVSFIE